jgi:shikimate dehydrogenase
VTGVPTARAEDPLTATRLGVVGWPVAHSRSPAMHNAALAAVGLSHWRYSLLPVPPELVRETLLALPGAGFAGVNVTIPHKAAAFAVADEPTPRARAIGAANTLLFGDDGRMLADNTDAPALTATLAALGRSDRHSALVLGAGGSARAAVWALRDAGVGDVRVWNRTPQRAQVLADELGARAVTHASPADVLVNCTALGLDGGDPFASAAETEDPDVRGGALPLTRADLAGYGVVADYVYAPGGTRLIDAARAGGIAVVDGLELLVAQGALSFEQFTGRRAPRAVMRAAARAGVDG